MLLFRLDAGFNANEAQLVRADIGGGGNVTLTVVTDNIPVIGGASEFTSVRYEPTIAPWVICSFSSFDGVTANTLTFIDPTDWTIAGQTSLSTSLNTAREIALTTDNLLLMGSFGGVVGALDLDSNGDGIVDASDLPYADNSSVPFYDSGIGSSFNGLDIAGGGEPVIFFDGDFDALTVGDNPDCGNNAGAGAWFFGTSYVQAGVCESSVEQFSIAATTSFDPGAEGNSLHLLVANDPNSNFHLPNRFNVALQQGDPVTVAFDIWVVSGGGGGSVYVGGDHGGGGYDEATDRGPQLTWNDQQQIFATFGGQNVTVVPGYQNDAWQSVRLEIDLTADTFDFFWGPRGEPLQLVGDNLGFRSGTQDMLDRFTVMNFGAFTPNSNTYFDNVTVTLGGCVPCDMNCDGTVDAIDIEFFIDILFNNGPRCASCTGDTNGDGMVNAADIEGFINCLFP
ncbi:MAG: hypothetical protein IID33_13890 [Planctomycetes bacterium]|nr:hypothetical protein [Planctomycetota bacterium]